MREEQEREEREREEQEIEELEREEREREKKEREKREIEEKERDGRRREHERKRREHEEREKEIKEKKEKEKEQVQEKMSQPIVSAILQHTPDSIIQVNHNNYIKLEEIGKGGFTLFSLPPPPFLLPFLFLSSSLTLHLLLSGSAVVYRVLDPALRCLALKCVDISSASEATIRLIHIYILYIS